MQPSGLPLCLGQRKSTAMSLETLHDLFVHELRDLYDAEQQLVHALPLLEQAATDETLRGLFTAHLEETKEQVKRLEQLFKALSESPSGRSCKAMLGLITELRETLDEDADPTVLDAALVVAAQKVEHYEIAGYGSVCTFADELGYKEAGRLLKQTLKEEMSTDEKLTKAAERRVNARAGAAAEAEV